MCWLSHFQLSTWVGRLSYYPVQESKQTPEVPQWWKHWSENLILFDECSGR